MSQPSQDSEAYAGWAVVELMGHRKLAGRVSQVTQYGAAMLRLDIPGPNGQTVATQYYTSAAIYCLTPTTEEIAVGVARTRVPEPVQRWELPPPSPPPPSPPSPPVREFGEDFDDDVNFDANDDVTRDIDL
jgi:hypothetical protein